MQELSFAEIMSYARIAEDNAIAFYQGAAAKAARPEVKVFLEEHRDRRCLCAGR